MIRQINDTVTKELALIKVAAFNGPPWNDHWTKEQGEKSLYQLIHTPGFYGLYAEVEGQIAGYALGVSEIMCNGVIFELKELCIAPQHQRKQHGTKLLEALKQHLAKIGITELSLITGKDRNINAFYLLNGFNEMQDVKIYHMKLK